MSKALVMCRHGHLHRGERETADLVEELRAVLERRKGAK